MFILKKDLIYVKSNSENARKNNDNFFIKRKDLYISQFFIITLCVHFLHLVWKNLTESKLIK